MALLDKIRRNGVPLAEYAGTPPYRGVMTGFNEAFLIDTPTRDRLVRDDPRCAAIIKPYLRGQDIERWWSPPSGLHMILLKSSGDHPWPWAMLATREPLKRTSSDLSLAPSAHETIRNLNDHTGEERGLRHREDHGRFWWKRVIRLL